MSRISVCRTRIDSCLPVVWWIRFFIAVVRITVHKGWNAGDAVIGNLDVQCKKNLDVG